MATMAQPTDLSIADVPLDILEGIFKYIQPSASPVLTVPRETLIRDYAQQGIPTCQNVKRGLTDRDSCRPYEVHLAQVCTTWRQVAMRLRNGDTINPRAYCARVCGDERLMEGYAILLGDSLRRSSGRVLSLEEGRDFVWERKEFYEVLLPALNLGALKELNVGHWVASHHLGLIAERLTNAKALNLQTVRLTLDRAGAVSIEPELKSFLASLHNAPLKYLTLDLALVFRPSNDPRINLSHSFGWPTRLGHVYPTLTHIKITHGVRLLDLETSAPNLQSLAYDRKHILNFRVEYFPPTLANLKQPTLTSLFLVGALWDETLKSIPRATLSNLKHFGVYNSTKERLIIPEQLGKFASWFKDMSSLSSLSIEDSCICQYGHGQNHLFRVTGLGTFFEYLPCQMTLQSLKLQMDEWDSQMVVDALAKLPALKEVDFTLRKPIHQPEMDRATNLLRAKGLDCVNISCDHYPCIADPGHDIALSDDDDGHILQELLDLMSGAVPYSDEDE